MKSGHVVKMVYDRMEDLAATTKRHPSRVRHRTALDRDGKLLAMDIDLATDGGAYSTLSSTVLSRATLHAAGPYVCPNIRIRSRAWATNNVPYGAFRGFGAPQAIFATERHMDEIAAAIGIDPVELRRRNFLHDGEHNRDRAGDARAGDSGSTARSRTRGERLHGEAPQALRERKSRSSAVKRGLGIAAFYHGSGFTGSGERYLNSLAGMDVTPDRQGARAGCEH
jgi:CO/xanthine dehydrogenase Mo-binding subunit